MPVALDLYAIQKAKDSGGDFYRAMHKQRPDQYQGIYLVSPDGKVLSSQAKEPAERKNWTKDLLAVIDAGLAKYGDVPVRRASAIDPRPWVGVGERDDGSIALAVHTRYMLLGLDRRGLGEPTFDTIILPGSALGSLSLAESPAGTRWQVPGSVVRRLYRVLSPTSDANTMPRADEVDRARLTGEVAGVRGGVAHLRYSGEIAGVHIWEFPPNKGKKIHAEMILSGTGTCDARSGKLLSLTLVGEGVYRSYPPHNEARRYGAVVEWRRER